MAKTAIIFGSTGLVGSKLLQYLINSEEYDRVKAFVRSPLAILNPKLNQIITDFDKLDTYGSLIKGDDIYLCLGTTMVKAGSKDAFYKIDYTYTMQAAKLAVNSGVNQLCLVSSIGANPSSSVFYSKVKGEIEIDLNRLPFQTIHIVRPSLLLGDRKEQRVGERIAIAIASNFSFLFIGPLKKYKPIAADTVASVMYQLMQTRSTGYHIYESAEIQRLKGNT